MISEQTQFLNQFHCEKNLLPYSVFVFTQVWICGNFPPLSYNKETVLEIARTSRGGFRGWGAVAHALSQGFNPCRPKGSPFVLFRDIHFWLTKLKNFLKAPLAPVYVTFEGGARAKKNAIFFVNLFVPKNAVFCCGAEHLAKTGSL